MIGPFPQRKASENQPRETSAARTLEPVPPLEPGQLFATFDAQRSSVLLFQSPGGPDSEALPITLFTADSEQSGRALGFVRVVQAPHEFTVVLPEWVALSRFLQDHAAPFERVGMALLQLQERLSVKLAVKYPDRTASDAGSEG